MTEQDWLESADPGKMLEFLRGKASERKLRLFAVACAYSAQHSTEFRETGEMLGEFLEGRVSREEYEATKSWHHPLEPGTIHRFGGRPCPSCHSLLSEDAWEAATSAAGFSASDSEVMYYRQHREDASFEISGLGKQRKVVLAAQAVVLRDIFGPLPFRTILPNPNWLSSTVTAIAEAIYDDRAFDRLPILADALEDAGCDNGDVLAHCRGLGPHVRGCFVVDLVLGKA